MTSFLRCLLFLGVAMMVSSNFIFERELKDRAKISVLKMTKFISQDEELIEEIGKHKNAILDMDPVVAQEFFVTMLQNAYMASEDASERTWTKELQDLVANNSPKNTKMALIFIVTGKLPEEIPTED